VRNEGEKERAVADENQIIPLFDPRKSFMRIADDGTAVEYLLGGEVLKMVLTWPHGVYVEWNKDDRSLSMREAKEEEQGIKPVKGERGYYLRVPAPPGVSLSQKPTGREPTWHFAVKKGRVKKIGVIVHRDGDEMEVHPVPNAKMIAGFERYLREHFHRAVSGDGFYKVGNDNIRFELDKD
jgi:hypothetical protein